MIQILFLLAAINYVTFNQNKEKTFNCIEREEEMYLKRGKYKIDIYGAQGWYGYLNAVKASNGGKGIHISAEFYITSETPQLYYVLVGGAGVPNAWNPGSDLGPNKGGFNGGGSGGKDNPTEVNGDAPGGGGGATDIRLNKNDYKTRLIVASGGSGSSWEDGNPGGKLCGLKRDGWNSTLQCSETTNTYPTGDKICVNVNGVGGTGYDHKYTPRGGGGGGYCGGDANVHNDIHEPYVSDSGSSYVKESISDKLDEELCFFNVVMTIDSKEGNGSLKLTQQWECVDQNCLYCKDAGDKCEKCIDSFLRYKGSCVSSCPVSTYQDGIDCFDCNAGCNECVKFPYLCLSCKTGYYLYNYNCLNECPETTTIQGKLCVDCEKPCYTCSNNATACTHCVAGYFLYKNMCIAECPLGTFKEGLVCSPCDEDYINCTDSSDFCHECQNDYYLYNNHCYSNCTILNNETSNEFYGKDDETKMCKKCDDQNCIDCSENYLICKECGPLYYLNQTTFLCIPIPTNIFTVSDYFSNSFLFSESSFFLLTNQFSESNIFTFSKEFSVSNCFSISHSFTDSIMFSMSNQFSNSKEFSYSNMFSKSILFSDSIDFTFSKEFLMSNLFSYSNEFTQSDQFKSANHFSDSIVFTFSNYFSKSKQLIDSDTFSNSDLFSNSDKFTQSDPFIQSRKFSNSIVFTFSNYFSKSIIFTFSKHFTNSIVFTFSNYFSKSNQLIDSNNFSNSDLFSNSNEFTQSDPFIQSRKFSNSIVFTISDSFSKSNILTEHLILKTPFRHKTTISVTVSLSYFMRRSVSYSFTNVISYTFTMIGNNGQISLIYSQFNFLYNRPYVINFYSPSYVQSIIIFEIFDTKRLTKEQLIAICCGSASIFFSILAIIIIAYKRRYEKKKSIEYTISDDEVISSDVNSKNVKNDEIEINQELDSDDNLNFWL